MAHKRLRGSEISGWGASLAAKCLNLFGWPWPAHVRESVSFLNQGCEYLDLELGETDYSQEFIDNSESAVVCLGGAQFGEVDL